MKCAVYVRVSTEDQAKDGYSLAAQTDKIVEYIKSKGWTYSQVYNDDGYSAASRRRPALQKMLDDAVAKQFEAVLVYRIDRLSRNLKDLIEIVEELAKNGAGFKSITELIDTTTPEGQLMFHQFGSFAQYERELISQRTSLGRSKRLKLGLWPGGCAPFGYNLVDSKLQIVEKEAKLVRLMFELYLNKNLGVMNIAGYLNDNKIKTRQGRKWRFTVVHKILNNPTYIGYIVRGGERITGAHKPIVKEEVFNKVKRNKSRFPEDFMLQLTKEEFISLRSQIVTSNRGGRRYLPYAFTEQGVAMLSSVLNSNRAILVNIHIMRAFVNLRRIGLTYVGLKRKIEAMEKKYDAQFKIVFDALKKLLEPPPIQKKKIIGFRTYGEDKKD
jgi:site-specific DNA recombinase